MLIIMSIYLPIEEWLSALYEWSRVSPGQAFVVFGCLIVLSMVLMVPVSIQAMGAGFIFGLGKGYALMCLAGLLGFVAAFQVGRTLARPWIAHRVRGRPEFVAIDQAIHRKGLAIVVLARLSLVLPYNLLNYSFGLTGVRLRDYALGSAIGMLPGLFMFVFIGTTATNVAAIMSGEVELGDYNLYIGIFGVLVIAGVVTLITRMASKALKVQLQEAKESDGP